MNDFKLGPTGEYPNGKIRPDDEGELVMLVGVQDGRVVMQFGIAIHFLGLPAEDALKLAAQLTHHANTILEGRKP